jgi:outer membrane lipoprotein SlyB
MRRMIFVLGAMATILMGCAGARQPVLYPNAHTQQVGKAQADQDVATCRALASQYAQRGAGKEVARDTALGGAGGAAVGAVGGAVSGYGAGRGAGVGAATGATTGLLRGLFRGTEPNPIYKNFVDRCLRERGYDVIGWQ